MLRIHLILYMFHKLGYKDHTKGINFKGSNSILGNIHNILQYQTYYILYNWFLDIQNTINHLLNFFFLTIQELLHILVHTLNISNLHYILNNENHYIQYICLLIINFFQITQYRNFLNYKYPNNKALHQHKMICKMDGISGNFILIHLQIIFYKHQNKIRQHKFHKQMH